MSRFGYRKYRGIDCKHEGCTRTVVASGYCSMHYARWRKHGDSSVVKSSSPGTQPNPEGSLDHKGYRRHTVNRKWLMEHRIIAEKALGKPLPPGAEVHHITENKLDNYGPWKLVICPNAEYHRLIHRLMKKKGISFKEGWPNTPSTTKLAVVEN